MTLGQNLEIVVATWSNKNCVKAYLIQAVSVITLASEPLRKLARYVEEQ